MTRIQNQTHCRYFHRLLPQMQTKTVVAVHLHLLHHIPCSCYPLGGFGQEDPCLRLSEVFYETNSSQTDSNSNRTDQSDRRTVSSRNYRQRRSSKKTLNKQKTGLLTVENIQMMMLILS